MKAIISTTYSDTYLFFLPIVTWCWNKLGVDVICFMPEDRGKARFVGFKEYLGEDDIELELGAINAVYSCINTIGLKCRIERFSCPEHKEATYAQCSRLFAGALDLPEDEILITSDVDMAIFRNPTLKNAFTGASDFPFMQVIGSDLVPGLQYPICYLSAPVKIWKKAMGIENKSYQKCLDELLGHEDMENMRGNLWSRDQETAFNKLRNASIIIDETGRARPGTQFASNRVDRDDSNWRSYLGPDLIDAHLWRPGYEENNFANIMELLTTQYPNDNFQWLIDYRNEYLKLL